MRKRIKIPKLGTINNINNRSLVHTEWAQTVE